MSKIKEKIIVISHTPTHPPFAGNRSCILSYCEMLKEQGYEVFFLWVVGFKYSAEEMRQTVDYWGSNLILYRKTKFDRIKNFISKKIRFKLTKYYGVDDLYPLKLNRFLKGINKENDFHAVIVNYIFLSKAFEVFKSIRKLLYTHDVFTDKYQNTGSYWFSVKANQESAGLNRSDCVLSIQEEESIFFRTLTNKKVYTTYSYFKSEQTPYIGNQDMLYLGGPNKYNTESLLWFINNVFDPYSKKNKEIRLLIGGRICGVLKEKVEHDRIQLLGDVESLFNFYKKADIVINPTYNGTGLKIKTFEALAYEKVLVCHPHSKIGVFRENDVPLFVCESPEDYFKTFDRLFKRPDLIQNAKRDARAYIYELNRVMVDSFQEALGFKNS